MKTPTAWTEVVAEAHKLATERGDEFPAGVFDNLADVVAFASPLARPPEIYTGYWPTILVEWAELSLEVFEDRVEVYPKPVPGEPIPVWYEEHLPGSEFSAAFAKAVSDAV